MAMLSPKSAWSWVLAFAVFPSVFIAGSSDAPTATYRARTSEVRISFFATDERNRLVESISRDDFAIVDSGIVIRDFRSLMRSNETALDIVVLVDASESVAPRFQSIVNDVLQMLTEIAPSNADRFSMITFAGLHSALLCSGDCNKPAATQKLLAIQPGDATPLFDAIAFASDFISKRRSPELRPVLIIFSDGHDTASRASAREAFDAVIGSGASIYAVDLSQPSTESENALNTSSFLEEMADATGGRSFPAGTGAIHVLDAVVADQRASYFVTYPLPRRVAGFHSLRILPKHNLNLQFHCRRGYNYEDVH